MLNRRNLLKLGMVAAPSLTGVLGSRAWSDGGGSNLPPSPPVQPFQVDLPLPGDHQPVGRTDGHGVLLSGFVPPGAPTFNDGVPTDYYIVTMQAVQQQIVPGPKTTVWAYNGFYPGQTFRARKNRRVVVRFVNLVQVPIIGVVHLHGAHTAPQFDGFPDDGLAFNTYKDYVYDNDADDFPATLWYHDHSLDFTGRNVYMGLAGFYILQDDKEDALNLPSGAFDIPLVLQDRLFDANNQLFYDTFSHDGLIGNVFLVNGAVQPRLRVARRKYRFRLLNGSNARIHELALSSGVPFTVIATEGGIFAHAVKSQTIRLGMAERLEIIVDFSKYSLGTQVVLNNIMQQTNGRGPDGVDPRKPIPLLRFDVLDEATDNSSLPDPLREDQPTFNVADAVAHRTFEFNRSNGAWQINGQFFDPQRVDARIRLRTTEIWTIKNGGGGWWHPVHIHLIRFRTLSRNGRPPSAIEAAGCKDTWTLAGGDTVDVIGKFFGEDTIHRGHYVFHCHNVEHEDMRMMTVMETVVP